MTDLWIFNIWIYSTLENSGIIAGLRRLAVGGSSEMNILTGQSFSCGFLGDLTSHLQSWDVTEVKEQWIA